MAQAKPRPSNDDRIRAALWFAERGFGIFPVWSTRHNGVCRCPAGGTCGSPGKHPITAQGFKDATTNPELIRTFLSAGSAPNYGMLPPEGVFILDVDSDEERQRLARLGELHGPLPATLTDDTANGQHIFLRWPEGIPRPIHKVFGLVTRWGSGQMAGYVIGPRSVHATGVEYVPHEGTTWDIATLPEDWARAAVAGETASAPSGTVRVAEEALPEPGGRHDWLRDRARAMAGVIRDPNVLRTAILAENDRLSQPKTVEEIDRAIGEVLKRFGPDPVRVVDEETGETETVPYGEPSHTTPTNQDDLFPGAVHDAAFGGLMGECVRFLEDGTDSSLVALMASMIAFCGALMPARTYWHGHHTSSPYLALVGKQGEGRKGTAMFRVRDALGKAIGMDDVEEVRFEGLASGEALVKALFQRDRDTKGNPNGILFEEEYETFLVASGREGSNLDSRMRAAFDGKQLSLRKVSDTMIVAEPYWLSGLVGITPSALRRKYPQQNFDNGSGTRWLWLPVKRRDVRVKSAEPIFPTELSKPLVAAHQTALKSPPRIDPGDGVDDLLSEYTEYLRAETVGQSAKLTIRYGVIALRIALVHASVERSSSITTAHVMSAIALTEYARAGIRYAFGDTAGDALTTNLLRLLLDSETGQLPQHIISKYVERNFSKRQTAIDELYDLGLAETVKVKTRGRTGSVLRLIRRNRDFRDFSALFGYPQETTSPESPGKSAEKLDISVEKSVGVRAEGVEKRGEGSEGSTDDETTDLVDVVTGEVERLPDATWLEPCKDYELHKTSHRKTGLGWVCEACSHVEVTEVEP